MSIITILGIAVGAIVLFALLAFAGVAFALAWFLSTYHDEEEIYL